MTTTEHITATVRGMVRWTLKIMEPHELEDSLTEQVDELVRVRDMHIAALETMLREATGIIVATRDGALAVAEGMKCEAGKSAQCRHCHVLRDAEILTETIARLHVAVNDEQAQ